MNAVNCEVAQTGAGLVLPVGPSVLRARRPAKPVLYANTELPRCLRTCDAWFQNRNGNLVDRAHKMAAEASLRFKLGVVVRTHNLEWRDGGGRPGSRPACLKGGNATLPGDLSTKVQRDTPNQSRVAFDLQPSALVQTLAILSKETFRRGCGGLCQ